MRYVLLVLFMFFSHVNADEIQRVESIIKDIKKLRSDYDSVVKELNRYKLRLKKQEDINRECLANKSSTSNKKLNSKAKSFRLNKNSIIYDSVDGEGILRWERGTSFTSNIEQGNWIKITGYFVNRAWRKSKKEMWIKSWDTTLRR